MKQILWADISLLLIALVWGVTFILVQNAIDFLEPFTFNAVRFTIAALLLLLWLLLFERKQVKILNHRIFLAGIFIGVWLFVGYAAQTAGLMYTTTAKAAFITGLSVVLVPFFSFFLLKNKPSFPAIFGMLAAAGGLYLLTMTDKTPLNLGDILIFICAIGFAMQIIYTGKYSRSFPALLLTVVQILTVATLSWLGSFLWEDWQVVMEPGVMFASDVVIAFIVTAIFATALAFFIQTDVQKYTSPTRVAIIFATEPVFAAITGYFWAHERLSASAIFGCILIFLGMIIAEMPVKKESFHKGLHLEKKHSSI